ncbi:hypothetical protein R1sor_002891 [Riccia sorocarpa]|uniref:Uncharacterized protein n=1 Tax=Riccia sorocarpa TaxID=122646 RepID=A0ABD3H2T2_9MARC
MALAIWDGAGSCRFLWKKPMKPEDERRRRRGEEESSSCDGTTVTSVLPSRRQMVKVVSKATISLIERLTPDELRRLGSFWHGLTLIREARCHALHMSLEFLELVLSAALLGLNKSQIGKGT